MHSHKSILDFFENIFNEFAPNVYRGGIEEYAQGQFSINYPAVIIDVLGISFFNNADNVQKRREVSFLVTENFVKSNDFEEWEDAVESVELIIDKCLAKFYDTYRKNNFSIVNLNEITAKPWEDKQKGDVGFLVTVYVEHPLNLDK